MGSGARSRSSVRRSHSRGRAGARGRTATSPVKGLGHGQIWWADLDKVRPVLVLTRARVAPRLTRVVVAPITTVVRGIGTEIRLGAAEGVATGRSPTPTTCSSSRSTGCF
ncbi:MAG: type II toxin-antitoxin system PemK/MazF family toxin, partial [Actinobacteria bacterium]|nr:type II toxin-antitoxin system PemK/MazF family toxin [Actinomycetota bacterium]